MKFDIVHIYSGTQGNGGLYLDEIYNSLKEKGYKQCVFVSYYFPFNYGKHLFFKYTDLITGIKNSRIRIYFRALELICGYVYIIFFLLFNDVKIVNFSVNSVSFIDYLFLLIIKKIIRNRILVTAHDVIPFSGVMSMKRACYIREKIFNISDYVLVHTDKSKLDLMEYFKIDEEKILKHSFPIMDLYKLYKPFNSVKRYDFIFIGHIRPEKGIFLLLESWVEFHKKYPSARLIVAGNCRNYDRIDISYYESLSVVFRLGYLSDYEYIRLLSSSKCLVLPYLRGTNSGVVFTALSTGINIICSNLQMFSSNSLLHNDSFFNVNNKHELIEKLEYFYTNDVINEYSINSYRNKFYNEIVGVYDKILNN